MRDLVFKNIRSDEKRRRIISSSETTDKEGIRSIIRRHFVYIIKEIKNTPIERPLPYLYVLKERNTKEQKEKFFCRMKGVMQSIINNRPVIILFTHSLKITFLALPQKKLYPVE